MSVLALLPAAVALWLTWRAARALARLTLLLAALAALGGCSAVLAGGVDLTKLLGAAGTSSAGAASKANGDPATCRRVKRVVRVRLSRHKFPAIVDHFRDVQRSGRHPSAWHLDRAHADRHRQQSLAGIPTKPGFDRDEVPIAASREGGAGADVRYVRSGENRAAGAVMGAQLRRYCSGQRFQLVAGT